MLSTHATLPDGGVGLDPCFDMIQQEMSNGRLKINSHLVELWDEINGLERDEHGKIIFIQDDILSVLRYAWMMRKHARESHVYGKYDIVEGRDFSSLYKDPSPQYARGLDFDVFQT
jgi:hypothetical protein